MGQRKSKKLLGYAMYFVAVGMPLTVLPQIYQIFTTKVATGLSVSSWLMYLCFGIIPLLYALANHLKPLVISNILWIVVDIVMIYGIVRYSPGLMARDFEHLLLINNVGKFVAQIGLMCLSLAAGLFAHDVFQEGDS